MRNYYYEHQRSFNGENFFTPVDWSEGKPTYLDSRFEPDVQDTYTYEVTPPVPSAARAEHGVTWLAQDSGYTEAGEINSTVGDGGFVNYNSSSSFAESVDSTSTFTSSYSTESQNERGTVDQSFTVQVAGSRVGTATELIAYTHEHTSFKDWDEDTYVSLGSQDTLTFDFSSSVIDFMMIEPATYLGHTITNDATANPAIHTNVSKFNVSFQDAYFEVFYIVPRKASRQTKVEWRKFHEIGSVHVDSTVVWPVTRFNVPGEKVVYGSTFEQTLNTNFPWLSRENLTVLTTLNLTQVTTTTSSVSNIASSSYLVGGSARDVVSFGSFMTAVDSITLLFSAGTSLYTQKLRIPLVSFATFMSFTDILPPGESFNSQQVINSTSSVSVKQDGFAFYTYPESIYQQRLLIHSHFGAYFINHVPISGYAAFIQSFTSTSPIFSTLSTKLVKSLAGATFKGYFPYYASIIKNVYQFAWNNHQSHEQYVIATEFTTLKTSTTRATVSMRKTTTFDGSHYNIVQVSSNMTTPTFTTKTSFQTTYLDTIYYRTSALTTDGGIFTFRRKDHLNKIRSQIVSIKLGGAIYGTGRIMLNLGGGIGAFQGDINSLAVGGYDYHMKVLGFTNQPTVVLNWGNWIRSINTIDTEANQTAEGGESTYRILRGEHSAFQSTVSIPLFNEAIFFHKELYRLEIINESFLDFALEAYFITENQTRNLRFLTSSPLHPARAGTWNSNVTMQGVREI